MLVSDVASLNAELPMLVTPAGITTAPAHESLEVTTLVVIVNVPEDPQFTGPSATACAGLIANPEIVKTNEVISGI